MRSFVFTYANRDAVFAPVFFFLSYNHYFPRVGGGGVLKKVLYGEAPPRGPTPYPFIYHFFRKGTPFVYLLFEKGTPFIYL